MPTKHDVKAAGEECTARAAASERWQRAFASRVGLLAADLKVANFKITEIRRQKEDDPHHPGYSNFQRQITVDAANFPQQLTGATRPSKLPDLGLKVLTQDSIAETGSSRSPSPLSGSLHQEDSLAPTEGIGRHDISVNIAVSKGDPQRSSDFASPGTPHRKSAKRHEAGATETSLESAVGRAQPARQAKKVEARYVKRLKLKPDGGQLLNTAYMGKTTVQCAVLGQHSSSPGTDRAQKYPMTARNHSLAGGGELDLDGAQPLTARLRNVVVHRKHQGWLGKEASSQQPGGGTLYSQRAGNSKPSGPLDRMRSSVADPGTSGLPSLTAKLSKHGSRHRALATRGLEDFATQGRSKPIFERLDGFGLGK